MTRLFPKHALSLVRYNWPLYLIGGLSVLLGSALFVIPAFHDAVRLLAFVFTIVATWYTIASFAAFYAMFDRSPFLSGRWLTRCVTNWPKRCLQLSVSLEETTLPIERVFSDADCMNVDIFDPSAMLATAVNRARTSIEQNSKQVATPQLLPFADAFFDLTVVTLAAHEIREPRLRERFFHELTRITRAQGKVVIVEHPRNLAALLAFGPGLFHFFPRREWLQLANPSGLELRSEFAITPFIRIFVFNPTTHGDR